MPNAKWHKYVWLHEHRHFQLAPIGARWLDYYMRMKTLYHGPFHHLCFYIHAVGILILEQLHLKIAMYSQEVPLQHLQRI